jgi:hypothetical protein
VTGLMSQYPKLTVFNKKKTPKEGKENETERKFGVSLSCLLP